MLSFELTEKEEQRFRIWAKQFEHIPSGCVGGSFTFMFVPCSIGVSISVKHFLGSVLELTDTDDW